MKYKKISTFSALVGTVCKWVQLIRRTSGCGKYMLWLLYLCVSWGYRTKFSRIWWLNTAEVYSLTSCQVKIPKYNWQGYLASGGFRVESIICLFLLQMTKLVSPNLGSVSLWPVLRVPPLFCFSQISPCVFLI